MTHAMDIPSEENKRQLRDTECPGPQPSQDEIQRRDIGKLVAEGQHHVAKRMILSSLVNSGRVR
jgi:hypothetical protein